MIRGRRVAASLLGAAALAGCYAQVPAPLDGAGPAPSGDVHVVLSPQGTSSLVTSLGPRATALEGRVVNRADSSITMIVRSVARSTGTQEDWPGDQLTLPLSAVQTMRVRKLSVGRTVAFSGIAAVAAFLIGNSLRGQSGSGGVRGGEPQQGK
ncbi:hypothetical protein J421_2652 [Gemmatirosa kalamazoonensis]|uniref:Lipoprotein n=1 Tax=Gemmatirosa kalamazoonensis TaxID=861299 RepID=W0RGJ5_9BACT|nr:hypothetical protein [Gemmatirosa kalamazoonensis]AHG90189.1 hypothetical protein J421_2652 [Gemmatirosa kalamazoonensis]